jgi:hypothetical protein
MMQDLIPFMSKHDLATGGRWSEQIAKELDESSFGIICLAHDNLQSPWILFEAGALTKHVEGRACCLLLQDLNPADVSGPLAQFQNARFNHDEVRKLVADVNARLDRPIDSQSVELIFEKWWPDLNREVRTALEDPMLNSMHKARRSERDILEELLVRLRAVEQRLEPGAAAQAETSPSRDALRGVTDRMARLTFAQLSILSDVVTASGLPLRLPRIQLQLTHDGADIEALLALGLLVEADDGVMTVTEPSSKLIAEFISRNRW